MILLSVPCQTALREMRDLLPQSESAFFADRTSPLPRPVGVRHTDEPMVVAIAELTLADTYRLMIVVEMVNRSCGLAVGCGVFGCRRVR